VLTLTLLLSQLLQRVAQLEKDYSALYALVLETNNNVVKAQSVAQPTNKEVLEQRLQIKWQNHQQVERVFEDSSLVNLLKTYVRLHIPSGNPVEFHRSFIYTLMERKLFARSFFEDFG
jgi:aconitase B